MTKNEFMTILSSQLSKIPENERKDMLYDYEEHFTFAIEEGKTEEEICSKLGDPREIAKHYIVNYKVNRAETAPSTRNIASAVLSGISLGFFNLILFLPISLALAGVMIGFFAAALGIFIAGVAVVFSPVLAAAAPDFITVAMDPFSAVFLGIGTAALGALFFIGDYYMAKGFYKYILSYLKWNLKVVKGDKGLEG